MARSVWKGPYVEPSLIAKVEKFRQESNFALNTTIIKTFKRGSMIIPEMVGSTIGVHNGRKFVPVHITLEMIGDKLGSYARTRTDTNHAGDKKIKKK